MRPQEACALLGEAEGREPGVGTSLGPRGLCSPRLGRSRLLSAACKVRGLY